MTEKVISRISEVINYFSYINVITIFQLELKKLCAQLKILETAQFKRPLTSCKLLNDAAQYSGCTEGST